MTDQNTFGNVNTGLSRELKDSLVSQRIAYNQGSILVTTKPGVNEPSDPFATLDKNIQRSLLQDGFWIEVVDKHHPLNVLRSLYDSTDLAARKTSAKLPISYIFRQDEGQLSPLQNHYVRPAQQLQLCHLLTWKQIYDCTELLWGVQAWVQPFVP